jgi:hypothetical protein
MKARDVTEDDIRRVLRPMIRRGAMVGAWRGH